MKTKICSKCQENKNVSDFYKDKTRKDGYRSRCKICCNIESGEYQKLKPEISRKKSKTFREKHPTKVKEIYKKWRSNNISKEQKRSNEWKKNNRDKVNIYKKNIRNLDPVVKLVDNVRNRINQYIKHSNISKHNKTFDIVGCSPEFLKEYLEKQFTNGMSWELMGQHIHIDHIIPLSSAKTEEEVYKLCHYTNLQPLWAEDNLKKGSKIL